MKALLGRISQAGPDGLGAFLSAEFRQRKEAGWQAKQTRIKGQWTSPAMEQSASRIQDVRRILELAESAYSL